MKRISIVIPAAGIGSRMRTLGPKALVKLHKEEPLILRQLRLLKETFSDAFVTVVTGYEDARIEKILPAYVNVVKNPHFENTNVAHSIRLGILASPPWLPLLIVYGDLVFNLATLQAVKDGLDKSNVIVDTKPGRESEVGLTVVNDRATVFSYGLQAKWGHIATLCYPEQCLFMELCKERLFGFEVFNEMLLRGANLAAIPLPKKSRLVEVDTSKDLINARKIK